MMIEIIIDGVNTTREENEIYREFVETKYYDFCKMSNDLNESREVIGDWLSMKKYEIKPSNRVIIEFIAFKI